MKLGALLLLHSVLLSLLYNAKAYKLLLVFPIATKSHAILGEGYVKHLAKAGHEITYITPTPIKNPPRGVRQIDISENTKFIPLDNIFDTRALINKKLDLQHVTDMTGVFMKCANGTLHMDVVQKFLHDPKEQFDAVIIEWLYTEMFAGLAAVFNCPLIWSSSMEPHSLVLSLIDDYLNPAYTLHHLSRHRGFSFIQRVHQLWMIFNFRLHKWRIQSSESDMYINIFGKIVNKRGRTLPPYEELRYNASLMLGNSHVSTGEAISLPQNYKPIGGYHLDKDPEPLPEHLQKIMDDAKTGVIYFSMGSMLKSSRIPENLKRDLLNVFGELNQTVIWKFEEVLPDLPRNVHIISWAPQTSILAHPNCVLFITHGGLLSLIETVHFGIPLIGLPQYADQFINTQNAEHKGFGKKIDLNEDGPRKLLLTIREILGNSSYRERAREYSFIHHHRPVSPQQELVHWVEHVIRTRGALHLRSPALLVPWYQKYYVDLAAVILILIVILIRILKQVQVILKRYSKEKML